MTDGITPRLHIAKLKAEFDHTEPRRIDFILLSKHFDVIKIKGAQIVFNEQKNGLLPSDHYGVEATLESTL